LGKRWGRAVQFTWLQQDKTALHLIGQAPVYWRELAVLTWYTDMQYELWDPASCVRKLVVFYGSKVQLFIES